MPFEFKVVEQASQTAAETRSIPVVFALSDPDPRIVVNQAVQARVFTGRKRSALSAPATAVVDDGGQRVVYVMRGGESFARVPVRLGLHEGNRYEVLEGLKPGDRVVALLTGNGLKTPDARNLGLTGGGEAARPGDAGLAPTVPAGSAQNFAMASCCGVRVSAICRTSAFAVRMSTAVPSTSPPASPSTSPPPPPAAAIRSPRRSRSTEARSTA